MIRLLSKGLPRLKIPHIYNKYAFRIAVLGIFLLCLTAGQVLAQRQQLSASQMYLIQQELDKRGITELEARTALLKNGIDIDRMRPEEVLQRQERIVAILDELAASKKAAEQNTFLEGGEFSRQKMMGSDGRRLSDTLRMEKKDSLAMADSIMLPIPEIYGHSIFKDKQFEVYRTTDGALAPENYIIGKGDRLRVSIFGISQADMLLEVNEEGYVQPTGIPKIFVQGMSLQQARRLLPQRFAAFYRFRTDQFSLTLQTARTIMVNAFGETQNKGSFSLSALNTAFNALAAAGGVSEIGSVRDIQLIRGSTRKTLDVYAFMDNPAVLFDFDLQHNDIIFVPVAKKIVLLEGAVRRPMRYELAEGETLTDLLRFAGGIQYNAYPERIQVEHAEGDSVVLIEYDLSAVRAGKLQVPLSDGDIVRVDTSARPLEQFVELSGAVFYPGRYSLGSNPSLRHLLDKAQPRPESRSDVVFVERKLRDGSQRSIRVNPIETPDFALEPRDSIVVMDKATFLNQDTASIVGAVRQPLIRVLSYEDALRIADALTLAGGLKPTASPNAYLQRKNWLNPEVVEYIRVDLNNLGDATLRAGDRLYVFERRQYFDIGELSVSGSVMSPLKMNFDPNLTIRDLLIMSGGITRSAALNRVDVFRASYLEKEGTNFTRIPLELDTNFQIVSGPPNFRLQPYDQVVVRDLPLFDLKRSVQISGQVFYPGEYSLSNRKLRLSGLIAEAGGLTQMADPNNALLVRMEGGIGQVGIDLGRALREPGSDAHDPVILPGDVITILPFINTIGIRLMGTRIGERKQRVLLADSLEVNAEVASFIFQGERSARWYIYEFAGGFERKADRSSLTVTMPDGRVQGSRKTLFIFRDYPSVKAGSTVSVALKPDKTLYGEKKSFDAEKLFAQVFQTITTILSLTLLIRQL